MNSKERNQLQSQARAKRVYQLRAMGLSVKETAAEVNVNPEQIRKLQLLGERLISIEVKP